jgi:hypothetical protein
MKKIIFYFAMAALCAIAACKLFAMAASVQPECLILCTLALFAALGFIAAAFEELLS